MSNDTNNEYWADVLKNRMSSKEEVTRLTTVLLGFLYRHNEYAKATNQVFDIMTPVEFWDSKRPYGNKDVAASIAFNLGWDTQRVLMKEILPEFVEEEAYKLHDLVKEELIEEEEFNKKMFSQ